MMNNYSQTQDTSVAKSFQLTYAYMSLGLLMTSITALLSCQFLANTITQMYSSKVLYIGFIVVQIALLFVVARVAQSQNKFIALSGFLFLTAFEGFILSPIFLLVPPHALISAFVSTVGLFGVMAMLGFVTKVDMSRWYGMLMSLTVGIIIAGIVNMFILSSVTSLIISIVTMVIFSIWTAYDNQRLRIQFEQASASDINQIAIMGATNLYFDALNIFISLLQIFSRD